MLRYQPEFSAGPFKLVLPRLTKNTSSVGRLFVNCSHEVSDEARRISLGQLGVGWLATEFNLRGEGLHTADDNRAARTGDDEAGVVIGNLFRELVEKPESAAEKLYVIWARWTDAGKGALRCFVWVTELGSVATR